MSSVLSEIIFLYSHTAVLPYTVTKETPAADYRNPFGGADVPTDKWSEATNVHDFPTDAFGQVTFDNEDEGSLKPSK